MVDCTRFLPAKVCYCLELDPGAKILLAVVILIRLICMILGCLYGPYLYLVLPLGGLYLAADILLLYTIFGTASVVFSNERYPSDNPHDQSQNAERCDYQTQRIWIQVWLVMNVLGMIGLIVAIGLFADLGFWSMSYYPLHLVLFFLILLLVILLLYTHLIVTTLYVLLKDAWLAGLLGSGSDEEFAGLTHGGKRVFA